MTLLEELSQSSLAILSYGIHSSSASSGSFLPDNLLVDRPDDMTSRWSGVNPGSLSAFEGIDGERRPWVLLELKDFAILTSIKFGKYRDSHPCAAQGMTILAGPTPHNLHEIGRGSLRNDSLAETQKVKWKSLVWTGDEVMLGKKRRHGSKSRSEQPFAVKYIKILPGPAYEPRFNTSLWYVELAGYNNASLVKKIRERWSRWRTLQANRIMLKQLRSSRLEVPYDVLRKSILDPASPPSAQHVLEHPLLTDLYVCLVKQGDFETSEVVIQEMIAAGLLSMKVAEAKATYGWREMRCDGAGGGPCPRGGHALAANKDEVFLFGGWDGKHELDDLWQAQVNGESIRWQQLTRESPDLPWPSARIGHVMAADDDLIVLCGAEATLAPRTDIDKALTESTGSNGSHGLVADDLMDIVENAVGPVDLTEKANVLWIYERSSGEWRSVEFPEVKFPACELDGGEGGLEMQKIDIVNRDSDSGKRTIIAVLVHVRFGARHRVARLMYDCEANAWSEGRDYITPQNQPIGATGFAAAYATLSFPDDATGSFCDYKVKLRGNRRTGDKSSDESAQSDRSTLAHLWYYDEGCDAFVILRAGAGSGKGATNQPEVYLYKPVTGSVDCEALAGSSGEEEKQPDNLDLTDCGHHLIYVPGIDGGLLVGGSPSSPHPEAQISCKRLHVESTGSSDVKRACFKFIRKQRFSELVESGYTSQALAYLKGPLQQVASDADTKDMRGLVAELIRGGRRGEPQHAEETDDIPADVWQSRNQVYEDLMTMVDFEYKQPDGNLTELMPL